MKSVSKMDATPKTDDRYLGRLGITEAEILEAFLALRRIADKVENQTGHRPKIRFDGFALHIDAQEASDVEFVQPYVNVGSTEPIVHPLRLKEMSYRRTVNWIASSIALAVTPYIGIVTPKQVENAFKAIDLVVRDVSSRVEVTLVEHAADGYLTVNFSGPPDAIDCVRRVTEL